ncbi:MAG: LlsX family protein [Clostridiales bacterium]|nr:LlsX family protein [Clostridiales bacterium]
MKKKVKIMAALVLGFAVAMIWMSVAIYFGYTDAYNTGIEALTVKILGIPVYELTKSGTEYVGKSTGIYMGFVCGICMLLSVVTEELIHRASIFTKRNT